jgi:hypothetical protein
MIDKANQKAYEMAIKSFNFFYNNRDINSLKSLIVCIELRLEILEKMKGRKK